MHHDIDTWFNEGCKYAAGAELYTRYGSDNFLKRILAVESRFNHQKLIEALDKIRRDSPEVRKSESPKEEKKGSQEVRKSESPKDEKNLTWTAVEFPELLKVKELRQRTFDELRSLHPYLSVLPEGEELRLLAVNIKNLRRRNMELWAEYNDLLKNGPRKKPESPAPVMVPIELINAAENLRKSISKAEKRLKEQNPPSEKTIQLIKEQKVKLEEVRAAIAAFKGGAK